MEHPITQRILKAMFDNPLGRRYLGVPKGKRIYRITSASVHYWTGEVSPRTGLPTVSTGWHGRGKNHALRKIANLFSVGAALPIWVLFPKLAALPVIMGDTEGPLTGGTFVSDAGVGTVAWVDPSNAGASDDVRATADLNTGATDDCRDNSVKLVKGGTIQGDDKAAGVGLPTTTDGTRTFGGVADLWGLTFVAADVNANDFGFAHSVKAGATVSEYLKATNFGFSITAGATVDGIETHTEYSEQGSGAGNRIARIDHMQMTVTYTPVDTAGALMMASLATN